jgi:hypothetical protein
MNYVLKTKLPDAEDAQITQKTQKNTKNILNAWAVPFSFISSLAILFFGIFLRPLRNFCVLCVRQFLPLTLSRQVALS